MARRTQREIRTEPAPSLSDAMAGVLDPPAPGAAAAATLNTAEVDERAGRPPSWEDFQAEVERQAREDAEAALADPGDASAEPAIADPGPNPDTTPPFAVCPDPLWEVTCPGEPLPRATIQAASAELAEERYRQRFLIRRPKVSVRKLDE